MNKDQRNLIQPHFHPCFEQKFGLATSLGAFQSSDPVIYPVILCSLWWRGKNVVGPNISAQWHFPVQFRVELTRNELNFTARSRYLCVNRIKPGIQHQDSDLAGYLCMCLTLRMNNYTEIRPHTGTFPETKSPRYKVYFKPCKLHTSPPLCS